MKRDESLTDEALLVAFLELLAQFAARDAHMGATMGRKATLALNTLIMTEQPT